MNTLISISTLAEAPAVSSPSMARRGFNALWRWPGKEATLLFTGLLLAWQLGAAFFTTHSG